MVLLILVRFVSQQVELSQVRAPFFVHDTAKKPDRGESARLEAAGRLASVAGQIALLLAYRIGSRRESGAAVAALAKQFREAMDKALAGVDRAADPLDEIRARRDRKRSAGWT